jgi:hypothetical protein
MTDSNAHALTVETHPTAGTIGTCVCGLFSMVAPVDVIHSFHKTHIRHPSTAPEETAS